MNSFYDVPRSAPKPSAVQNAIATPTVPEVSMIFSNQGEVQSKQVERGNDGSYAVWKLQNQMQQCHNVRYNSNEDKENKLKANLNFGLHSHSAPDIDLSKKQVRFQSPVLQQNKSSVNMHTSSNFNIYHNKPLATKNNPSNTMTKVKPVTSTNILSKPFEEIYMANIPNRHLDLSIADANMLKVIKQNEQSHVNMNNENDVMNAGQGNCESIISDQILEKRDFYKTNTTELDNQNCCNIEQKTPSTYREYKAFQKLSANENTKTAGYRKSHMDVVNMVNSCKTNDIVELETGRIACRTHTPHYSNVNQYAVDEPRPSLMRTSCFNSSSANSKNLDSHVGSYHRDVEVHNSVKDSITQTDDSDISVIKQKDCKNSNDEPTVKDLLKIIHQQNEQLLLLQKQVANLIENQNNAAFQIEGRPIIKQIESATSGTTTNIFGKEVISSTEHEIVKPHDLKKASLPKFAIDVMTSFEVSIRRQQNFNQRNKFPKDFLNHEPKIQEITTSDTENTERNFVENIQSNQTENSKKLDESLVLNGSVPVLEECVSPENSIHIDMQDYSSDSDTDDSCTSSNVGWTVYNNVMDQVNNILQKSQGDAKKPAEQKTDRTEDRKTKRLVREATIKHLKSIGVNLPPSNDTDSSGSSDTGNTCSPSEISFAVKQLLMKYLPNDQLAKMACIQKSATANNNKFIRKRPEFSFATLQYMEKYNLLAPGNIKKDNPTVTERTPNQHFLQHKQQDTAAPKILDITALKQQPKLL